MWSRSRDEPKIQSWTVFRSNPRIEFLQRDAEKQAFFLEHEEPVAVYRDKAQTIFLTNVGLHQIEPEIHLKFAEFHDLLGPKSKDDDTIIIQLKDGTKHRLTITGGDGKFKDIFSFVRFLDRVMGDFEKGRCC